MILSQKTEKVKQKTETKKVFNVMSFYRQKKKMMEDQTVIRKGPWKVEEDEVLINHVKKYGPRDWSSIRTRGLLHRTGKSCRLRWVNKLQPNLKNGCKFSMEEERVVIELQAEYGNKWAKIAGHLNGRTDNDVKNFWSSRQKRLARIFQTSGSSSSSSFSSSNPKPFKIRKEVEVIPVQEFPNPEVKKSKSSMEEEPNSETQSYSPSYIADAKTLKMVQLPELFTPKWQSFDTSVVELPQESQYVECPISQNPEPALKFSPESQDLLARLDDPYFFDVFEQLADEPEIGNAGQVFPIEQPFPVTMSIKNETADDGSKHVAVDMSFDGIFDHIEPLPDPLDW